MGFGFPLEQIKVGLGWIGVSDQMKIKWDPSSFEETVVRVISPVLNGHQTNWCFKRIFYPENDIILATIVDNEFLDLVRRGKISFRACSYMRIEMDPDSHLIPRVLEVFEMGTLDDGEEFRRTEYLYCEDPN